MKRSVYILLGSLFAILGIIGVLLPVMPGIIFFALAAYFFSNSSPYLHQMLYRIPHVGNSLRDWEQSKQMQKSTKRTVFFLFFSMAIYPWLIGDNKAYAIVMTNVFIVVAFCLFAIRPSRQSQ